jgi:hypothetical protein
MKNQIRLSLLMAIALIAVPLRASAQQATTTFHPGKVNIGSTATKGVCVGSNNPSTPTACTGELESQFLVVKGPTPQITLFDSDAAKTWSMTGGTDIFTLQDGNDSTPRIQLQHSLDRIFLTAADVQITSTGVAGLNMANSGIVFQNATSSPNGASIGAAGNLLILSTATGGMQINNQNHTTALFAMSNAGSGTWAGAQSFPFGSLGTPGINFATNTDTGFVGSGSAIQAVVNGVSALEIQTTDLQMVSVDNGAAAGRRFIIGRNSNTITPCGAELLMIAEDNVVNYIWADASDQLRITTASGGGCINGDTSGTIVGTQTSTRASKNLLGRNRNPAGALSTILRTPVYDFTYRNGAYNGETFTGIVTEESPAFSMDNGKSFNPVTAFGTTVLALQEIARQINELRGDVAGLKAEIADVKKASPSKARKH